MNVLLSSNGEIVLESSIVTLRGIQPVVNGLPLQITRQQIKRNGDQGIVLEYDAPALEGGTFLVEITRENESHVWLRYWIERLPEQVRLDSFGIRLAQIENLRAYLRNGYFSWDGSEYIEIKGPADFELHETSSRPSYAMTQLLPLSGSGSLVIGFERHDRFQQTFTFDLSSLPALTVETLWDRKARAGALDCQAERLVIFEHTEIEEALRDWARRVAAAAPIPPRHSRPIVGWCSWYNLYAYITEEIILEHLRGISEVVRREQLPMQVFQIDDGFTPEMGDWLEVKPQFPRGMKPLLDDIRAAGFTPGLWIAPFMVGNRSRLYREHPDWVVRDNLSGGPLVQLRFYGEFRWHKRSEEYYILDITQPDAFEYLRSVFHIWRHEWGCEYFKTDFMHFGSGYGPDRARWYTPGLTRIEVWRRAAEMVRQEIGDALWLGCGCPLWASVGLVDGIRISHDVGVEWKGERTAESLLRDQQLRNFANGILWLADPDCILLREHFHYLTDPEITSLAIYAGMSAGVLMTSDALHELSPARLQLWKLLLNPPGRCRFPLLGQATSLIEGLEGSNDQRHPVQADPFIIEVRTGEQMDALFIFNTGETALEHQYTLASLGLTGPLYVFDWTAGRAWEQPVNQLSVTLSSHGSALLFVSSAPIHRQPQRLP